MIISGGNTFYVREEKRKGMIQRRGFFKKSDLYIDSNKRFTDAADKNDDEIIDAEGCYVIPGLVDVHMHGCMGYDFCDGNEERLAAMAAWQFSQGITSFCATSMTYSESVLSGIFSKADCVPDDGKHARIVGIHMEGPFVAMEKKGAQNPDFIMGPDEEMFDRLMKVARVPIRLITIAPEMPGAMDFIKRFHDKVHISLGHSAAGYENARQAFDLGADHVTHLYNAMSPFMHRKPGIIGAAAGQSHTFVELICDGIHVHPAVVRATFSMMGAHRMVLISDSMRATGLPDGKSELGGQTVYKKGLRAELEDGTLAGSVSTLMTCMCQAVRFGIPLDDAVLAATANPAKSIGMDSEIGVIKTGARADVVILDKDLNIVRVI